MKVPTQAGLEALARELGEELLARRERLACAESCTGGWAAMTLTAVAGSSAWFERGFVTYSNEAKVEALDVSAATLKRHGAVSEPVVREMLAGTLRHSHAEWALAVSGVAGPGGGSPARPVGTVCFAWGRKDGITASETRHFAGDRQAVRAQAVKHALRGLLDGFKIA